MKVTVIVDNIGACGLNGEWGLCLHISHAGLNVLLDTGSSALFAANLRALDIDIGEVDAAVLSHGYFDHANGMETFFLQNDRAPLFMSDSCAEDCYSKHYRWKGLFPYKKYIGMPRGITDVYAERMIRVAQRTEIYPGITLLPHTAENRRNSAGRHFYRKHGRRFTADDFAHEQTLVWDTGDGVVAFSSCSHIGVDRILDEVNEAYPDRPIRALIGGFHLVNRPDSEVKALAERLKHMSVERLCTGHCTGDNAYVILKDFLGDRVSRFSVGSTYEF